MYYSDGLVEGKKNRGKMKNTGWLHAAFNIPHGSPGRIFYIYDQQTYPGKEIVIKDIVKHNDSRYGKIKS